MAPFVEDENNVAATNGTSRPDSSTTNGTTSGTTNNQKIPDPNGITLSQLPENHDPLQPYKIDKFDDGLRYDTLQIHGGHRPDKETHARAVPIYNSVSFVFTDSNHAKRICSTEEGGYFYSRISNPTVAVFEKRAAALEGGTAAIATSSGQAAIFNTIICLAGAGDNIIASINLYGGTYSLFKTLLPRLGITVKWAKRETREEFKQYIDDKTKMIFVETIGNPRCSIPDLQDLGDLAHENNVPFVVDNTFGACGTWCRPIDFGANIIVHSATKWMGGHGTTLGGVIIDCGTFDWGKAIHRFPRLSNKDGPMSFSYWKSFGNICFAMAMRIDILMEVGSMLAPASAQQLLIGMETLSIRCERHARNTMQVARFLQAHPRIAWVNYPGLEGNIYHENAKRYLKNGFGGVLAFGPKGGEVASKMLMNYVKVVSHQTNVGDAKTLATHPWNSTHVIMSEKDRREAGITPAFIRFSVGIEDVQDIIDDLDQALAKHQHQVRGFLTITDDCSFTVSQFDMLSGSDVHFWGSIAPDLDNLTNGFIISDYKLNETYKNASFSVKLSRNATWDRIQVLSIWDLLTESDFGHVILSNGSDLAPAPSGNDSGGEEGKSGPFRVPTMFDNCKVLSDDYRVRWSLDEDFIDIGLEAAITIQNYMAFGWANPNANSEVMIGGDVAVAGFTEEGMPFVDDFYITRYSECTIDKDGSAHGVCPDTIYEGSDPVRLVNNTKLSYGHRRDGVSFIRYRRPLVSVDTKYDLPVNYTENMTVIWALGLMRPPDTIRPYYLPQNHGGRMSVTYGHLVLNVSDQVNECLGPLDAADKEDQDLIIADANKPLVVTTGPAVHYPNPPNPSKVLYINKKEAPVLKVERGVPVKFSVQAGHDVALYITSDLIGGNATLRNKTETIYAGGSEAEGVLASPMELIWEPDRNTPDQVYYHSLFQKKMGWRVQVVDGGLSDMYNNSVLLDDQQVTFFWTLSKDSISIAARGEKKSGYIAIGFGTEMVNSYAYVGWIDDIGKGHVNSFWIDGRDASSVHPTNENLTDIRCKSENGIITFEFTRPLKPCSHNDRVECKNIIDPTTPLKVIWALGTKWSDEHLNEKNMHFETSHRPIQVLLMRGSAEAEQDLRPVLAVHGFMMFLAWGILLPGGIMAARYLKHVKGDSWYQTHVYLQYSGLAILLLGLLFAVAELRGLYVSSAHVKFGLAAIFLACVQPVNASMRPKKPSNGEEVSSKRRFWEYLHVIVGRSAIIVGIAALFSGLKHLGDRYGDENVHGYLWALILWFAIGAMIVTYLEYQEKQRRSGRILGRSNWVLGNLEEEDSIDLLSPARASAQKDAQQSGRMEVQLEPMNR